MDHLHPRRRVAALGLQGDSRKKSARCLICRLPLRFLRLCEKPLPREPGFSQRRKGAKGGRIVILLC
jgi:hypothetical protein